MKTKLILLLSAAVFPFMTGCIARPTNLSSIGPDPSAQAVGTGGRLQVFSATQVRAAENTTSDYNGYFYPHSSYEVKDQSGNTVKYVRNRASFMDESPDVVKLAPGEYNVVAESTWCGLVSVPVVVDAGKTTVVHLDGNWNPSRKASHEQIVYLPNGQAAGWSGAASRQ